LNRRMDNRNNNTPKKKNWLITLVTILFLAAVGAGVYLMIAGPEGQQTTESLEKTSFSEREYQGGGGVSVAIDKEEEVPETIEPGTVTDQTEQDEEIAEEEETPETEESSDTIKNETVEEVEQPDDSMVVVPEPDLSSMIANAKSYVYTLYTDLDQGSGFLFNNKGDILTNAHVVKYSQYLTVKNSNGQEFNGRSEESGGGKKRG